MPGGDGTGPLGTGGRCTPYRTDGQYARPAGSGCGFGRGFGRGMGRRFGYAPAAYAPALITKEEELQILTEESSFLESQLNEIKKNIARAFDIMEPKQVYVDPDCGMKLLPQGIAYEKLRNMCEAARQMRSDLE